MFSYELPISYARAGIDRSSSRLSQAACWSLEFHQLLSPPVPSRGESTSISLKPVPALFAEGETWRAWFAKILLFSKFTHICSSLHRSAWIDRDFLI
jgi:hypothetical protein